MPRKDCKIVTPSFCHAHNIFVFAQPSRGRTCDMTPNMQTDVAGDGTRDEALAQRELKRQWRKTAIARRKRTNPEERLEAGRKLAEQARQANLIHSFTTVAAFASMGSEMSMTPMLQTLFDSNCRILVPRLGKGTDIGWSELDSIHDRSAPPSRPSSPTRTSTTSSSRSSRSVRPTSSTPKRRPSWNSTCSAALPVPASSPC